MSEPTLEVVVERLKGLDKLINEKFHANERQHNGITDQQKIANGRVKNLEADCIDIKNWKARAVGVFIAVNAVFLPIVFIVISKLI